MNPFLHDTLASPLAARPVGSWQFPFARASRRRISRQAGLVAVTAMTAMTAGMALVQPAQALDVNVATHEQLQSVRGVGPRTARIIVDERARAGRFDSMDDLSDRVRGIGPKRLQTLHAAGLRVGGDAGQATGVASNPVDGVGAPASHTPRQASGVATPLLTTVSPHP